MLSTNVLPIERYSFFYVILLDDNIIYASCIYLRILVSNTISVSNGVHACLAVTLLVSLVEQELLTLQEDMSSHASTITTQKTKD
jgi:hypothetical protein